MNLDSKVTPMMAQWHSCKESAPGCILLFRMGDFYEAFHEDAEILSTTIDLTLTKRQGIKMAGIPHHTYEQYLEKLVLKGYRVAIAEQVEDPKSAKGLVKREIVRIVTPGTLVSSSQLVEKNNNFFASLIQVGKIYGLALIDLTTGDFKALESEDITDILNETYAIKPSEFLISKKFYDKHLSLFEELRLSFNFLLTTQDEWTFDHQLAYTTLVTHFGTHSLDGFGLKGLNGAINAAGALLTYLQDNLSLSISHIHTITSYSRQGFLALDRTTLKNLELTESLRDGSKNETLLELLDHTKTAMGSRLMRSLILQPLTSIPQINERQEAIEELLLHHDKFFDLFFKIKDLERLMMRVSSSFAQPKDLVALKLSLEVIPLVKKLLELLKAPIFKESLKKLIDLSALTTLLGNALNENAPHRISDGYVFKEGYHLDLDELREISKNGKTWLLAYQNRLRDETGIKTLKVGFTGAFGYYIEVSKGQAEKMPPTFQRRQTLVNCERFISPELKDFEEKVLTAEERIAKLETELFNDLRQQVAKYCDVIFEMAKAIAFIDCLASFSYVSQKWGYTRPIVDDSSLLHIVEGRHPVIESSHLRTLFTPNDTLLDDRDNRLILITGPNMAGKSTYIRQVALIALMAHMGCFVPAKFAHIGLIDKIFTRIGASDDLSRGQSTFMVEMSETANILNHATSRSLVILDEIGRGTSTYDGIAIAWSTAEYLLTQNGKQAKTLFATHYFELTALQDQIKGAINYNVLVAETAQGITFLHKIAKGSTDKSYGLHVAKLAGMPSSVIERAQSILLDLEEGLSGKDKQNTINARKAKLTKNESQMVLFDQ